MYGVYVDEEEGEEKLTESHVVSIIRNTRGGQELNIRLHSKVHTL